MRVQLSFAAWSAGLSGGDRHLLEMAARWRAEVELDVVAPDGMQSLVEPFLPGVRFTVCGAPIGNGPLLAGEYVRRAALAELRGERVDVVVASSHFLPGAAAVHAGVRRGALGVSYVYHLVSGRLDGSLRSRWAAVDERLGLTLLRRSAALVFTSNAATAARLRATGIDPVHTDVGIDIDAFAGSRDGDGSPLVLFLGRLMPSKGLTDAIEAFAAVHPAVPGARLVIAGTGPARPDGERRARELGVAAAVDWAGFVSEDEKRRLLRSADVLLAPSREEGWGISVAEALASGLPVVAYRLPALDEIFGDAYRSVPVGDTAALAGAMRRLLFDRVEAARISAAGRAAVARYDLDRVARVELDAILASLRIARRSQLQDGLSRLPVDRCAPSPEDVGLPTPGPLDEHHGPG